MLQSLLLLDLGLLLSCQILTTGTSSTDFDWQPMCPTEGDKPQLSSLAGVATPAACVVECALRMAGCSAGHYNGTAGACWFADRKSQWQDRWAAVVAPGDPADCAAFVKSPASNWELPYVLMDSLMMWYDFRYGLTNLVGNASFGTDFPAQLILGAVRNSSGAALDAATQSHVGILVPGGFEAKLFGAGSRFSIYMKVQRRPRGQEVNYLQTVESGKSVTFLIEGINGEFSVGCRTCSLQMQRSAELLPSPLTVGVVSVGFHYDGSAYRVYYRGSLHSTSSAGPLPAANTATEVRLGGRSGDAGKTLDGRILCFGLAARDLSAVEFLALEDAC